MGKRIVNSTKRRRCVTLDGEDLELIKGNIPNLSAYLRRKLREEYPSHYGGDLHV